MRNYNLVFVLFFLLNITVISCKKKSNFNSLELIKLETIKVDVEEKPKQGDFEKYFSASKIVSLETNEQSLFSEIDRIITYKDKILILNKDFNGVFIFDENGRFLNKIQNIGRGPQEYISLWDFTFDEENENILLYSDNPLKIFFYDLKGKYIKEKRISNLYNSIGFQEGKCLFVNELVDSNHVFYEKDLNSNEEISFLNKDFKDEIFKTFTLNTPSVTKVKNTYVSFPYLDTIYQYDKNGLGAKYYIDFGNRKVSDKIIKEINDPQTLWSHAQKNKLGFGITSFRETKDYIIFSYNQRRLNIYSKKDKILSPISYFKNDKILFSNYYAHSGNDNKLISILSSSAFKKQMKMYKENEVFWMKIPDYLKELEEKTSENDNPLLIVYTFKE